MNPNRIEWIDTLRGLGIFFVFLGHTTLTTKPADHYIYSFHMPLFFFISGMFWKPSMVSGEPLAFLKKSVRKRMVPYISFGLITYGIWLFPILMRIYGVYQGSIPTPDNLFIKPMVGMLYGVGSSDWLPHNSMLWFLACLFVTEVLFFFIHFVTAKKHIIVLLLVFFSVLGHLESILWDTRLPLSSDIAFVAVLFFGLGFLSKDFILTFDFSFIITLIFLLIGLCTSFLNDRIDMNYSTYGYPILFYISSLSSILGWISIAKRIPNIWLIRYVGKNSLSFFLLQNSGFFVINIFSYLLFALRPNKALPNLPFAFLYVFLTVLFIIPAVYLINKKLSFITGRSINNKPRFISST